MKFFTVGIFLFCACSPSKTNDRACKEAAKKDCVCTMQYDPVCGCDNVTYSNACMANCEGVQRYTKGACK